MTGILGISRHIANHNIEIEIAPHLGANLISFKLDGREFIHFNQTGVNRGELMTGAFHMFPTPCRLKDGRYNFQGREFRQQKRGVEIFEHGLLFDEAFMVATKPSEIECRIEIDRGHPVYEGFPIRSKVCITYRLLEKGLLVAFTFENRDYYPAPIGYGLHPYWQITEEKANVLVQIPADTYMELLNLLPTGKLLSLKGSDYDFPEYRALGTLEIDAVYYPRKTGTEAGIIFLDEGLKLRIEASENMRHMICYSPADASFVCVENLTCSPNAPNLYNAGFIEESGLKIVNPGELFSCWIRYSVESLNGI